MPQPIAQPDPPAPVGNKPSYLTRLRAAEYCTSMGCRISKARLAQLAVLGGGPLYRKWGQNALYTRADLDAWMEARLGPVRASTSDQQ